MKTLRQRLFSIARRLGATIEEHGHGGVSLTFPALSQVRAFEHWAGDNLGAATDWVVDVDAEGKWTLDLFYLRWDWEEPGWLSEKPEAWLQEAIGTLPVQGYVSPRTRSLAVAAEAELERRARRARLSQTGAP